ncbi:LysR family transcriptional regulator [Duganella sp. BJB1802]|uniref:LysR family transcriptional regulator n=1 Tax=Duganella sp. BJB1802 TaxID=2744575 RepID=UPI00159305FF|nr:LysR family transcriptional regulator [Duganella sp. BJB1802]NVD72879.1 LysR family transcriptional regulator [Duganella sp. BJB1802]
MRTLDTHALQMFVAVAQCLNFRQAAEQLHMTQPPLSRAVRQLEERLGVKLFERDTQHVALTPAAAELLPRALRILALLDEAEQALQTRQPAMRLRLGMTSSMESDLYRAFTDGIPAALGGGALETLGDRAPRLVARLRARGRDAAIIARPTKTFDLPVQPLGKQPTLVALSSRHPLARRRSLSLADLQDQPVYWFERARQPAFFDHSHAVFRKHGFAPRFLLEPHDHHVLLSDVAAGKGMALLPTSFAAISRTGVAYRKLKEGDELAAGLGLIVADGHPAEALLRRLAAETLG